MKKTAIAVMGALSLLLTVCGLCKISKDVPRYEQEQSALLFELNEYRGAYNEYALSLSCDYKLAQEIASKSHATLEMREGADFGTLRFEDRTAEQAIVSGDLTAYIPYLSPEFYLYPTTVEGSFSDSYANENERYLYSHIGLGDNGEVRNLTKGSTDKYTSRVVIIDTGIDYDHEEFVDENGNPRISELSYSVGDGKTVKEGGWEIIDDNNSSHHGTMVAGSIFANSDNGKGVAGLAEDVELIVVKMPLTANGGYEINSFLSALDYCLTLDRVDVINMSLGFFYSENPFSSRLSRLKQRGTVVVCAAGNEERSDTHYPSADPNVIGVGAFDNLLNVTGNSYQKASYSAFGDNNVDIAAPGRFRVTDYNNNYSVQQGTSISSPVVTAAVALYRSLYPDSTVDEVMAALYASADDQGLKGKDYTFGYGGLNIHRFLTGEWGSVTFDFGDYTQSSKFILGTALSEYPFPAARADGKIFGGWYLDAACSQPFEYYTTVFSDGARLYAKWEDAETGGVFDYTFGDNGVYIKGYYGVAERLILPAALTVCGSDYPVVGISARAFQKSSVKQLMVPNSVKTVEEYAFADNNFTYLYLPNSLTRVDKYAVRSVKGTVYVQGAVTYSIYNADWNILSDAVIEENSGAFTLENGMALLGDSARTLLFYVGGGELSLVSAGGKITSVREDALAGENITSLSMPNVTTVGARAFKNCEMLVEIDAPALVSVEESAFENCSALTELKFPQSLVKIGNNAFANCVNLLRFTLQKEAKLTEIGNSAFASCIALQSVDLTQAALLTHIGSYAFDNCKSLFLAALPDNVNTVSAGALRGCEQLVSLRVPFLGDGSNAKTHLGFIFGSSYSSSQQVPKTLRYVSVTREIVAADALQGLSNLRVLANGRYLGTAWDNEVFTNGSFALMEIRVGDILCGLIGGAEGEVLTEDILSSAYFTPAGYTAIHGDFPTTLKTGTVNLSSSVAEYTISFYDGEKLLSSKTYSYGERVVQPETPVRASTAQYRYDFVGWGSPVTLAVKDAAYTAQFSQTLRSYAVRFYDADGTLLKVEECDYGAMPTPPECADRYTDNAQYYKKFVGWNETIVAVTGEKDYTAVYEDALRSYSITFRYDDENGEIIASILAEYGTLPVAPDTARPADSEYSYTFIRWQPEFSLVTGEATYVAVYERTQREYTVRFLDWNGTVLKTQQLHYGEMPTPPADPGRDADEENDYVFIGWGNVAAVAGDVDYVAQYRAESHYVTITFLTYNGGVIEEQRVLKGSEIIPPQAPERTSTNPASYRYEFDGWTPAITVATADAVYTAHYTQVFIEYIIKFVDWDGTVLSEQSLRYNSNVTPPDAPARAADERNTYEFAGWDSQITAVDGDKTYTATYTAQAILYTVRFLDNEGNLIAEAQYEYGEEVTPPVPPEVQGFEFVGWDRELSSVTGNAEYRAVYRQIEPTNPPPPDTDNPSNGSGCGGTGCGSTTFGDGMTGGGTALLCTILLLAVFTLIRRRSKSN